jgi:hypothetical protein
MLTNHHVYFTGYVFNGFRCPRMPRTLRKKGLVTPTTGDGVGAGAHAAPGGTPGVGLGEEDTEIQHRRTIRSRFQRAVTEAAT